jgi:hypothetical protein
MRIVFLNSLEKKQGDEVSSVAQVWIAEEEGIWRMGWNEAEADEESEQVWYEGTSWSEMLHNYRYELAAKLSEGFYPLMEGLWNDKEMISAGRIFTQKLHCYCELNLNHEVYTELCAWRRKKAASEHRAAYFIANNRLLLFLSVLLPHNEEELIQIPGMGSSKIEAFGSELIAILKGYNRNTDFPLNWIDSAVEEEDFRNWLYKQKQLKFKNAKQRFAWRQTILKGIEEGQNLSELSAKTGMERRDLIKELEELEKTGNHVEKLIILELQEVSVEDQQWIWRLYEQLGDAFLKPILEEMYGHELEGIPEGVSLEALYERLRLIRIRFRRSGIANVTGA